MHFGLIPQILLNLPIKPAIKSALARGAKQVSCIPSACAVIAFVKEEYYYGCNE